MMLLPQDIPSARRLQWTVVVAMLLLAAGLSTDIYTADEARLGLWIGLTVALLALAFLGAVVSGHVSRLKADAYKAAKRRLAEHNRKENE